MKKIQIKWILRTFILTFSLAVIFSVISELIIRHVNVFSAFLMLLVIIFIGIFFDAIGIAVAAASEKPFHAMSAAKIESARYSILLIKNASKVSNFCNDVIGDIAGIISGTTIGIILGAISKYDFIAANQTFFAIIMSGIVAALTVGGKAMGKDIAINHAKEVVDFSGKTINLLQKILKFKI